MKRVAVLLVAVFAVAGSLTVAAQQPSAPVSRGPLTTAGNLTPRAKTSPRAIPLSLIQGNALTSSNRYVANSLVRLRDARIGRIVATQRTDNVGLFSFRNVEPASYIVELLAADETTVLAASQLLNIGAGETVSAVVKLPFGVQPPSSVAGYSVPSAIAVTTAAAASNVLAVATRGEPTCAIGPVR